jgi:hypothetical protein
MPQLLPPSMVRCKFVLHNTQTNKTSYPCVRWNSNCCGDRTIPVVSMQKVDGHWKQKSKTLKTCCVHIIRMTFCLVTPLLRTKELCTIVPRCTHASLLTFWTVWNASPVGRMAWGNSMERHTLESTGNIVTGDESGPASRWPAHRPLPVATSQVLSPLNPSRDSTWKV